MWIKQIIGLMTIFLIVCNTGIAAPTVFDTANGAINEQFSLEETGQSGRISWNQSVVEAFGIGLPPENAISAAQARNLARRAAIVDAYRNLAEVIQGVQVDSETTMQNLQIRSDVVKTKVSSLIKGAKILREQSLADGSYRVVMAIKLYGEDSLATIALNEVKPEKVLDFPKATLHSPIRHSSLSQVPYSGVVVDARGLDLQPTFSPRIYDETGRIIYGNLYIDTNLAITQGMVDYASTAELYSEIENGKSRAGINPIVVKAIGIRDNECNVIISASDADKILMGNEEDGFLKKLAIVFEK